MACGNSRSIGTLRSCSSFSSHSTLRRAKSQDNSDSRQSELTHALQYNQMSRQLRNGRDKPPALLLQQADIVAVLGREDEARRLRQMVLEEPLNDAIDRYYDAIQQIAQHRYAEATPELENLRRETPRNFFVWFLLGNSYAGTGDFNAAEPCFTTCAAPWPDSDTSYFHRGLSPRTEPFCRGRAGFHRSLAAAAKANGLAGKPSTRSPRARSARRDRRRHQGDPSWSR